MNSFLAVMAVTLALATISGTIPQPSKSSQNEPGTQLLDGQKASMPDLQVGCGEGHLPDKEADTKSLKRSKRRSRRRDSYVPWSDEISFPQPYQSINVWKPALYALGRPYAIPMFGREGRPPMYFPPQPLLVNPGEPKDNPKKYQGPKYLPPTPEINERYDLGDDFDGMPIWDLGGVKQQATTSPPSSGGNVIPTRVPIPPGGFALPPLIHNPTDGGGSGASDARPGSDKHEVGEARPLPPSFSTKRPPGTTTTSRPNEPTRCAWAVISCCSTTGQISYDCFEERGCPGAFWDNSPCDGEFAKAAISAALNYYN